MSDALKIENQKMAVGDTAKSETIKSPMSKNEKLLDALQKKKVKVKNQSAAVNKKISIIEGKIKANERKQDAHLKTALGATLISLLDKLPPDVATYLIYNADSSVAKSGLARERYEELKLKYKKQATKNTQSQGGQNEFK